MRRIILVCFVAAFCITDSLAENKSLLSDYWKVINNHEKKHGEKAEYDETTYDKEFRDGMFDICIKIENFMKDNGLSISASAENTDFLLSSKKYDCAHVCDEVSFYYDLMVINFACIKLLPDYPTTPNKDEVNMALDAADYCESLHDQTWEMVQAGYTRIVVPQQTKCKLLDTGDYKCVESAVYANTHKVSRMYGKCCVVNCKEKESGRTLCSLPRSPRVNRYNINTDDVSKLVNEVLTLDDYTDECVLKE